MGVVYKALDPVLDRTVAIKTLNLSLSDKELKEYEARFYQEAKATGKISHPNIVSLFDVGRSDGHVYMAMEYLEGQELRTILDSEKRLDTDRIVDIARQVAEGLAYAHDHHIVHRDIKPSNIMILRNGLVKITDFGIAMVPASSVKTMTGMVMGSPQYMSPEQVSGKKLDHRADIFSLGVVLYEMLTGKVPFTGENIHAIMYQTVNLSPSPPSAVNPEIPRILDYIVAKSLAKQADERYQSARELAEDLKECASQFDAGEMAPMAAYFTENESQDMSPTLGISKDFDSLEATRQLAILTEFHGHFGKGRQIEDADLLILWGGFLAFSIIIIFLIFYL
jgi:serine/threonine-protein kinase